MTRCTEIVKPIPAGWIAANAARLGFGQFNRCPQGCGYIDVIEGDRTLIGGHQGRRVRRFGGHSVDLWSATIGNAGQHPAAELGCKLSVYHVDYEANTLESRSRNAITGANIATRWTQPLTSFTPISGYDAFFVQTFQSLNGLVCVILSPAKWNPDIEGQFQVISNSPQIGQIRDVNDGTIRSELEFARADHPGPPDPDWYVASLMYALPLAENIFTSWCGFPTGSSYEAIVYPSTFVAGSSYWQRTTAQGEEFTSFSANGYRVSLATLEGVWSDSIEYHIFPSLEVHGTPGLHHTPGVYDFLATEFGYVPGLSPVDSQGFVSAHCRKIYSLSGPVHFPIETGDPEPTSTTGFRRYNPSTGESAVFPAHTDRILNGEFGYVVRDTWPGGDADQELNCEDACGDLLGTGQPDCCGYGPGIGGIPGSPFVQVEIGSPGGPIPCPAGCSPAPGEACVSIFVEAFLLTGGCPGDCLDRLGLSVYKLESGSGILRNINCATVNENVGCSSGRVDVAFTWNFTDPIKVFAFAATEEGCFGLDYAAFPEAA